MLFSGMVATAVGIAVVLGHNVWSGGWLPVVVTAVGWAALLKGSRSSSSPRGESPMSTRPSASRFLPVSMAVVLALGLWMTAMAFAV